MDLEEWDPLAALVDHSAVAVEDLDLNLVVEDSTLEWEEEWDQLDSIPG